jgi:hypothetical protein
MKTTTSKSTEYAKEKRSKGEKKAMENEKKTNWYTSVSFDLNCHNFFCKQQVA